MERRVLLSDVAAKSGFHLTTVSRALRDDPTINPATRKKIKGDAKRLGYRPDPMLKALSVYREGLKPTHYHATVAWILPNSRESQGGRPEYPFKGYYEGAVARGVELGYRVEEFALASAGMSPGRLEKILRARGIGDILIAPFIGEEGRKKIRIDWSLFNSVALGFSLPWPVLHRVTTYHFGGARLAVRKLHELGYRRIGLSIDAGLSSRVEGNWTGGYFFETLELKLKPFILMRNAGDTKTLFSGSNDPVQLSGWIAKNSLDAVIFDWSPPFVEWLGKACGRRVPEDIGVASLNVPPNDPVHSGVCQNEHNIGWLAMNTLVSLISTHERGIPKFPRRTLVDGTWNEGRTVRRIRGD